MSELSPGLQSGKGVRASRACGVLGEDVRGRPQAPVSLRTWTGPQVPAACRDRVCAGLWGGLVCNGVWECIPIIETKSSRQSFRLRARRALQAMHYPRTAGGSRGFPSVGSIHE